MTFEKLGLSESVLRGVRAVGYSVPTEIQSLAIPPAISGSDVIGRAKTGSGKTAAFILPTIDRLLAGGGRKPNGVRALVLTPTRELAQQVADATFTYARHLKLRGEAMYGGVGIEPQLKKMRQGVDILAATPGRLIDHIERGSVDLSTCEVLIVDEADRMFDMGFINDVKRIIAKLPKNRQTLLFSATMSKEVRTLTSSIMNNPVFVEVGVEGNPAESVRQHFFSVPKQDKFDFLAHLLNDKKDHMESVLVFSRTKHGANKIAKRLTRAGVITGVLHSDRSQSQRQQALDSFKQGRVRVLIATDIAARGIDVVGISHVINFDTPNFAEDYVHRIGRTGRADATGDAITFVASDEKDNLRRIERFVGRRYDVMTMPKGIIRTENPDLRSNGGEQPAREYNRGGEAPHSRHARAGHDRSQEHTPKRGGKFAPANGRSNGKPAPANGRSNGKPAPANGKGRRRTDGSWDEGRAFEGRPFEDRRDDGRNADTRNADTRNADTRNADTRKSGGFGSEGKKNAGFKSGTTKAKGFKPNGFKKKSPKGRPETDDRRRDPRFA